MKKSVLLLGSAVLLVSLAFARTKYTAPADITDTMMQICDDLGVACTHCHIGDRTVTIADTGKYDVEKDLVTLTHKRVAQAMIGMQKAFTEKQGTKTSCVSCHQGKPHPPLKK